MRIASLTSVFRLDLERATPESGRGLAARRPRRVLRSGFHTFRCVLLFAPSAPAVQVFISTMRAFDRSQLIIEIRQCFAARCCSRNRDDSPARSVLTQPSYVDL